MNAAVAPTTSTYRPPSASGIASSELSGSSQNHWLGFTPPETDTSSGWPATGIVTTWPGSRSSSSDGRAVGLQLDERTGPVGDDPLPPPEGAFRRAGEEALLRRRVVDRRQADRTDLTARLADQQPAAGIDRHAAGQLGERCHCRGIRRRDQGQVGARAGDESFVGAEPPALDATAGRRDRREQGRCRCVQIDEIGVVRHLRDGEPVAAAENVAVQLLAVGDLMPSRTRHRPAGAVEHDDGAGLGDAQCPVVPELDERLVAQRDGGASRGARHPARRRPARRRRRRRRSHWPGAPPPDAPRSWAARPARRSCRAGQPSVDPVVDPAAVPAPSCRRRPSGAGRSDQQEKERGEAPDRRRRHAVSGQRGGRWRRGRLRARPPVPVAPERCRRRVGRAARPLWLRIASRPSRTASATSRPFAFARPTAPRATLLGFRARAVFLTFLVA